MRILIALAILLAAPPARADASYRITLGAVDAAGMALFSAGLWLETPGPRARMGLAGFGLGLVTVGAPIVHAGHGNAGRAAISLGAHVVLPLLGSAFGRTRSDTAMFWSLMAGFAAASILDVVMATSADLEGSPRMLSFGARF